MTVSKLCNFIREREKIRLRKEAGLPRPWSADYFLDTYHFCNVRREDDRGTKDLRMVVELYMAAGIIDFLDLPWVYVAGRLTNHAPSLEVILGAHRILLEGDSWKTILEGRLDRGERVFNNAYSITPAGADMSKLQFVYESVAAAKQLARHMRPGLCREIFEQLKTIRGIGDFLAAQIVADLKNDRYLSTAPDRDTFSVIGPGSKKGLDLIFGAKIGKAKYQKYLDKLLTMLPEDIILMRLDNQDLQNCLCEWAKYQKYVTGAPGRRRYYNA